MKHLKLATIDVVYSVSMVLLLTAIGVVSFRESLNYYEIAGLGMAHRLADPLGPFRLAGKRPFGLFGVRHTSQYNFSFVIRMEKIKSASLFALVCRRDD